MPEETPLLEGSRSALLEATEESTLHSVLMVLVKILFAAPTIAGIVVGAVYLGQCPQQPLIPIYLIVLSAVVLLLLLLSCLPCGDGTDRPNPWAQRFRAACCLFLCIWFLAGNVWVYTIYPPTTTRPAAPPSASAPSSSSPSPSPPLSTWSWPWRCSSPSASSWASSSTTPSGRAGGVALGSAFDSPWGGGVGLSLGVYILCY
uniref:Uncharacterized protein n=1 Tax=Podarcis muralis TaxID=64176 RepID=A0A670KEZ2_PODMU